MWEADSQLWWLGLNLIEMMEQYCSTAAEDLSQNVNVNIYFYKPSYSFLKKKKLSF